MKTRTMFLTIMSYLFVGLAAGAQTSAQRETADLLPEGTFTNGIEGPATDKAGNLYAVNYGKEGTIGIVRPDGSHECFVTLPEGSTGNGIRFNRTGRTRKGNSG